MTPEQEQLRVQAQQRVEAQQRLKRTADARIVTKQDDGWDAGKTAGALARGTGEGIASTVDLVPQAGQYLWEVGKNLWEEGHGRNYERKAVSSPLTDLYNENMPAVPKGYENVNDLAAVFGPAVLETLATGGAGAPAAFAQAGARGAAKAALKGVAKGAVKSALHTAEGVGGSQVGGALGQQIGGDVGEEIGSFAGGALGGPAVRKGLSNLKDAGLSAVKHPYAALGSTGGGIAGIGEVLRHIDVDPTVAGLLAAAVPVGVGAARSGVRGIKKIITNPIGAAQDVGEMVPPTVVRVGSGQTYDDNPYLYHLKEGIPPVQQMKESILGLR
jgi:hypothetical protein